MPFGDVYDYWCLKSGKPAGEELYDQIRDYEEDVLKHRG